MTNPRTEGEVLFEQYLTCQGLPFEFEQEHTGKSKRADYTIHWDDTLCLFDVKDFEPPPDAQSGGGAFDPYPRIREKIDQGRDKFKEYKDFCCALVLRNLGDPSVRLEDADTMLGAMYGDSGFTFPVDTRTGIGNADAMQSAFLGRGKMMRPHWSKPQNTTISALITLTTVQPYHQRLLEAIRANPQMEINECEAGLQSTIPDYDATLAVPRVIVWHNAVARIRFPADLFCGPYDSHFGTVTVQQGVTFRGNQLPSNIKL